MTFIWHLFKQSSNVRRICLNFSSNAADASRGVAPFLLRWVSKRGEQPLSARSACNVRKLRRSGTGASTGHRLRANWPAELRSNGAKTNCTVADVSSDGANLLVESAIPGDAPLWLILENVGPIAAALAWQE